MGFKQVFDNLTVKHMDALRKQIQSLADFVLNHCFWDLCNVKEILRMITRNNLLQKSYLVSSDINDRYDIG